MTVRNHISKQTERLAFSVATGIELPSMDPCFRLIAKTTTFSVGAITRSMIEIAY